MKGHEITKEKVKTKEARVKTKICGKLSEMERHINECFLCEWVFCDEQFQTVSD